MFDRNIIIGIGGGLVLVIAAYLVYRNLGSVPKAAAGALGAVVGGAADVVSGGLNAGARAVTGDDYDTIGTAIWKWLNPALANAEHNVTVPSVPLDRPGAGATGAW